VAQFVSEPIAPVAGSVEPATGGEPSLPEAFTWKNDELVVRAVVRTWRGMKTDRGDAYIKRHWFEFDTCDNRRVTVYFDRQAKRGSPRWWLYSISEVQPKSHLV